MGIRRRMQLTVTATGLALAGASPVLAHDGPPPGGEPMASPSHEMMEPEAREAWLAECRGKLSRPRDDDRGADRCLARLDSYYAYYRGVQGHGPHPSAYGYPGACCQPMMMVPIVRVAPSKPKCKETVEYEYVDVPSPAPPRPVPDKRIKVVPDKRIKTVPDKRIPVK